MTRSIIIIAVVGIAAAMICLPLAAMLYHHDNHLDSWNWSGYQGWFGDDDDDSDARDQGGERGRIESRDFAWGAADRLELDVPANLHFQPAPQWHLSIRGPQRVLDRIHVGGGRVTTSRPYHHFPGPLEIELSGPALHDVTVNGAGKLVLDGLQQDALTVAIHGSGSVRANGSTDTLNLQIMGSGDAELAQLAVHSSRIIIAGSGAADVAPRDDADVFIAGSGDVRLHTHPKRLSSRVAGSGQIIEMPGQNILGGHRSATTGPQAPADFPPRPRQPRRRTRARC
jgi:hypothetical protein